ncbi:MAG TPA: TIGR00730 family Rossman fold protein [Bryobacteraceae bacterium]|jgi:hypothetical protein|nr:TIGR00730 family Rossman fold protein [Bryobacteraceae bacterium]
MKRVCIFCGSSSGSREVYTTAAATLAKDIVRRGMGIVYGGSNCGLMATIANTALDAGGEVIGVIPQSMVVREIAHTGLTELRIVNSMHERKALMADLSSAFVAMPGGYGTLDEFCEILTWAQLGLHNKPCGILNVAGYYNKLLAAFDHSVDEGFLRPKNREIVISERDPELLLTRLLHNADNGLIKGTESRG